MVTALANDLAVRFGGFRFGRGGDGFLLLLMGIAAAWALVWAILHSERNQSAKS
jgi:hypothetical protein